jgi:superfamily II DNA helicase RecQ
VSTLKEFQIEALTHILASNDCICSLPTGYGKSLIYEMLPFVDKGCLVMVVIPLDAIVDQQISKLGKMACYIKHENESKMNELLMTGQVSYLFCHPEQVTDNKELNRFFCSKEFKNKKVYVVIDEAHCILDWGQDFRPDFRKLYQLKALFSCQMLALSATITESAQQQIADILLMKNIQIVSASPAKDNITLIVKIRPSPTAKGNSSSTPYSYIFEPLLKQLKERLEYFDLTIIYCKTMEWIGYGYELALKILGEDFYVDKLHPRVVMFHSSMEKDSGKVRTIFCFT